MSENLKETNKIIDFIEKWALIIIIITAYLWLSFKIINALLMPVNVKNVCGNGFFGAIIAHLFFTITAIIVFWVLMFKKKNYTIFSKRIIALLIIVPPIISFFCF